MFWNITLNKIVNTSNISLKNIKNKEKKNNFDKKIKNILNIFLKKTTFTLNIIENYLKNLKNRLNLSKLRINYNYVICYKNFKNRKKIKDVLYMYVILLKKQTYVNAYINGKKFLHNTNGIVLKKNSILEKSRKKESKSSILNVNISINFIKNFLKNLKKFDIIVNLKNFKTFINKLNKLIKTEFDGDNIKYILTPNISFNNMNFKKIKSIKRRLRKKYKILDV